MGRGVGWWLELANRLAENPVERLSGRLDGAARNDQRRQGVDEQVCWIVEVIQRFLDVLFESEAIDHALIIASGQRRNGTPRALLCQSDGRIMAETPLKFDLLGVSIIDYRHEISA